MSTKIDGIGSSENIDTTGEIVSIAGMDISSLTVNGVFNWEHKSDQPSQIVGKILKAKKIFSEADCEDERQLYFWKKCKTPYLYVMGELFDEYKDSAREVAGMFRYDEAKKGQQERSVMNFSVEGAKISKKDITVTRSIARKMTITPLPANHSAVAEILPSKKKKESNELFKTENFEIEIFKIEDPSKLLDLLKKEDPAKHAAKLGIKPFSKEEGGMSYGASSALSGGGTPGPAGLLCNEDSMEKASKLSLVPKPNTNGSRIGVTFSGKPVMSHGRVSEYKDFSSEDHKDASNAHLQMAQNFGSQGKHKEARHHQQKGQLHNQRANSIGDQAAKLNKALGVGGSGGISVTEGTGGVSETVSIPIGENPMTNKPKNAPKLGKLNKALTAGSGLASPDRLVGGAALTKESLEKPSLAKEGFKNNQVERVPRLQHAKGRPMHIIYKSEKKPKSKWLAKAEEAYAKWEKREQFEEFMAKKMPNLTKGEIRAIGSVMMLQKSLKK